MGLKDDIVASLHQVFMPLHLDVEDQSHQHAGHGGWREGGETHFRVVMTSPHFLGVSRLARHRMMHDALAFAFARGLHALAISAYAPGEANARGPEA
jgi:BolA family transcriptional regulator, general stress-responsive regulator